MKYGLIASIIAFTGVIGCTGGGSETARNIAFRRRVKVRREDMIKRGINVAPVIC